MMRRRGGGGGEEEDSPIEAVLAVGSPSAVKRTYQSIHIVHLSVRSISVMVCGSPGRTSPVHPGGGKACRPAGGGSAGDGA